MHAPTHAPHPAPSQPTEAERRLMRKHEEALLDDALDGTFPCSDPVSTLMPDDIEYPDSSKQSGSSA